MHVYSGLVIKFNLCHITCLGITRMKLVILYERSNSVDLCYLINNKISISEVEKYLHEKAVFKKNRFRMRVVGTCLYYTYCPFCNLCSLLLSKPHAKIQYFMCGPAKYIKSKEYFVKAHISVYS